MNFNEEIFDIPQDPEPVSWQAKLAGKRRKKEANQFNEPQNEEGVNE